MAEQSLKLMSNAEPQKRKHDDTTKTVKIMLGGNVVLGRGVDQILPNTAPAIPGNTADDGTKFANKIIESSGGLPNARAENYIWGDIISIMNKEKPDLQVVNLETCVTDGGNPCPNKRDLLRTHPKNISVLKASGFNCFALANDHVMDFGEIGLASTVDALRDGGLEGVGAGVNKDNAERPGVFNIQGSKWRVLVFAIGTPSAGIPSNWQATEFGAGINYFDETKPEIEIRRVAEMIKKYKKSEDIVALTVHWGAEHGFYIEDDQVEFAHGLIDSGQVDLVHGHGSRHIKGLEIYKGKLIVYGAGDLISDIEAVRHVFPASLSRCDMGLLLFATISLDKGNLTSLCLVPTRLKSMQVNVATESSGRKWLFDNLTDELRRFNLNLSENEREFNLKIPSGEWKGMEYNADNAGGSNPEFQVQGLPAPVSSSGQPPPNKIVREIFIDPIPANSDDKIVVGVSSSSAPTFDDVYEASYADERSMRERFLDVLNLNDETGLTHIDGPEYFGKKLILLLFLHAGNMDASKRAAALLQDAISKWDSDQVCVVLVSLDKNDEDFRETLKLASKGWAFIITMTGLLKKKYHPKLAPSILVVRHDGLRIRKDTYDDIVNASPEKLATMLNRWLIIADQADKPPVS